MTTRNRRPLNSRTYKSSESVKAIAFMLNQIFIFKIKLQKLENITSNLGNFMLKIST